jgi:hypothetical protein
MDGESRLKPILGHLAWLADRIDDPVNDGRLKDAALLTYNAAAMLQWRFVFPVSWSDQIRNVDDRWEASGIIDGLVTSAEKIVAKADDAGGADQGRDKRLRSQLVAEITRSLQRLQELLLTGESVPARMPALEETPNARKLLDEFLAAHAEQYAAAIEKGRLAAAKREVAPAAALKEAIAGLIYIHDHAREAEMSPGLRRPLTQMAAGFFKSAVEWQAEKGLSPARKERLLRLANALVESAAPTQP